MSRRSRDSRRRPLVQVEIPSSLLLLQQLLLLLLLSHLAVGGRYNGRGAGTRPRPGAVVLSRPAAGTAGSGGAGRCVRVIVVVVADDVVVVGRGRGGRLVLDADAAALAGDDVLRVAIVAQNRVHVRVVALRNL